MLRITSVAGNIHADGFRHLDVKGCHRLRLSRNDLEKRRMRRVSDTGGDVIVSLEPGVFLNDGDIAYSGDEIILVEQIPEMVIAVDISGVDSPDVLVMIGHAIGNLHRPISIRGTAIYLPAQAESELELFRSILKVSGQVQVSIDRLVFKPDPRANIAGHG